MLIQEVRSIMTKNPLTVSPDDMVGDVANMMVEKRIQQIPVVKDKKLVGLITSYDLWKDTRRSKKSERRKVSEVMNTNILKIAPKDKLGTAAELFMDKRFKTIPVVNLRNELKGVVTAFDVIRQVIKQEYPKSLYHDIVFADEIEEEAVSAS